MNIRQHLPLILKGVATALLAVAGRNFLVLNQADAGLTMDGIVSYIAPLIASSGGMWYGAAVSQPNRELRSMVDGLLAAGQFTKAREMIQQWQGVQQ